MLTKLNARLSGYKSKKMKVINMYVVNLLDKRAIERQSKIDEITAEYFNTEPLKPVGLADLIETDKGYYLRYSLENNFSQYHSINNEFAMFLLSL